MYDFDYQRPATVADASKALKANPDAKLIAGGMTYIPTLKLRLAKPSALIDLGAIKELVGVRVWGGSAMIGAMARANVPPTDGFAVMSSRCSFELVQKCAIARCPVIVAVSAPTALALRQAEEAGVTLAAFARAGGVDIYSHANRIRTGASHVA